MCFSAWGELHINWSLHLRLLNRDNFGFQHQRVGRWTSYKDGQLQYPTAKGLRFPSLLDWHCAIDVRLEECI